jgi:formylglycine-generating enzyme required for sulfatase activity
MKSVDNRPLRVFLCHSSVDKSVVRELYQKLCAEEWIQPWFDEEDIFPGDDWNLEIQKAIRETDAIIVCLSKGSITKEGYVQREIKTALDYSDEKPERTVYIIPIRLEECKPPERLSKWQYADYFAGQRNRAFQRLMISLQRRAESLGLKANTPVSKQAEKPTQKKETVIKTPKPVGRVLNPTPSVRPKKSQAKSPTYSNKLTLSNGMEFMRVPAGKFIMGSNKLFSDEKPKHTVDIPYDYWMARYPVTNELYNVYVTSRRIKHPVDDWKKKKDHPVVFVKWTDAMEYCKWLNNLFHAELPSGLILRLPSEAEWEKAARGTDGREYPWGNTFDKNKCNTSEGGKSGTTSVGSYSPQGDSPYGCADMSGNVWEWTHSLFKPYPYNVNDGREDESASGVRALRGDSFGSNKGSVRCAFRIVEVITNFDDEGGFRVVVAPPL